MAQSSTGRLAGKVALITGASSGIGRAAAVRLAKEGADIALNFFSGTAAAEQAAAEIRALGRKCLLQQVDVSNQAAVEQMVARIAKELGRLDIFVSSAVYSDREPFTTADMAGFRKTIEVSMWGAFYGLRASVNQMIRQKQGGAVVIVSSPHAQIAFPNCMAYNMAKAALDHMARSAAMELLPHHIKVNIIYPGWIDTPGERKFFTEEALREASKGLPMGRLGTSEEIAHGIFFLCDPETQYTTGSTLVMDGGLALPFWSRRGTGDF
jgi:glucose 1-dehydrogenase